MLADNVTDFFTHCHRGASLKCSRSIVWSFPPLYGADRGLFCEKKSVHKLVVFWACCGQVRAEVGLEIEIALESSFVALLPQRRRPLSAALEAIHNK